MDALAQFIGNVVLWGVIGIVSLVVLIIAIKETDGWILVLPGAAGVTWIGYQSAYLWYSPNFWPIVLWSTGAIAAISVFCWIGDKWSKTAIAIIAVVAVVALLAFGFYANIVDNPMPKGGAR